ncbi:DUF5691 domain-containing protein [Streptomyces sp. NPDC059679]|uniref:DUF5691 domain-containing protein n=1 Tax=Streptomyces sp. NPDC059679 TaxID=3346903 RepID=UPI003694D38C
MSTTAPWDDLVAAALLGTERRTPPISPRPGQDAPAALLDAAALSTVRRRAGLRPAASRPAPAPAPEDPRPPLPPAARNRLAMLLAGRSAPGSGRRSAPDLAELLPQWLAMANQYGYRAPDALLPALLDAARARTDLRPEALTLGGARVLWLARLNPEWRFALRGGGAGRAAEALAAVDADPSASPRPREAAAGTAPAAPGASTAPGPKPAVPASTTAQAVPGEAAPRPGDTATPGDATTPDPAVPDGPAAPGSGDPAVSASDGRAVPHGSAAPGASTTPGAAAARDTPAAVPVDIQRQWEEGLFAERVSLLAAVRHRDPELGLALLGGSWSMERAEDRLMFLDSLRDDLSPSDEPFLEQALTDRSRNVRATAAELLSALPGSALASRMAERSRACVSLTAEVIAIEAPAECDGGMQRDGVVAKPPSGGGERAWWFGQLVEATPLERWSDWFGGRGAAEIVALPVADGWQADLQAAWCRAAVRQRNAEWSRALLGVPSAPPAAPTTPTAPGSPGGAAPPTAASWRDPAKLLSALPPAERAEWVADFIAAHGLSDAFRLLGVCAVPWAEPLGRAVVDALDIARDAGSYPWSFSGVMGLAERCLDPDQADRLEVLTAISDEPADGSPGAGGYWSEAFQRLVGTLRLRAAMRRELEPPAGATPTGTTPTHPAATGPAPTGPAPTS